MRFDIEDRARRYAGPRPTLPSHPEVRLFNRHAVSVMGGRFCDLVQPNLPIEIGNVSRHNCGASAHPGSGASLWGQLEVCYV